MPFPNIDQIPKHADQACITLAAIECTALEDKKMRAAFMPLEDSGHDRCSIPIINHDR